MPTHTETYRTFTGSLRPRPLRFWPLARSGVRVALRRKLPLVLLFAPPLASMCIFSFIVYARYATEAGSFSRATGFEGAARGLMGLAARTIEVKQQIALYNLWSRLFAFLILAWYGAGLVADDRRWKAHLLYFSRPLTRLDYVLGKLAMLVFLGACAVIVPGLVICATAVFASPEWSFLTQEGGTILATLGYGALWVVVLSLTVLAVSSLSSRKSFALVGVFAVVMVPQVTGNVLRLLLRDDRALVISPWANLRRLAEWFFETRRQFYDWPVSWAFAVIGGFALLCALVLWWRVRKLEEVG